MSSSVSPSLSSRVRRAFAGRSADQIVAAVYKTMVQKLRRMAPAARAAARADAAFDRQWGIDTSREVTMSALDYPASLRGSSHHYQASGTHVLDQAIACAGIDPSAFSFVDLGCGKGRVVLLAAARGFVAAIGVEYSPLLTQIARSNAATFVARGGAAQVPLFWQGNAANYSPPEGNIFVYLYNSFGADILSGCLDQLEAAKRLSPSRRIVLVYVNAQHGDTIAARRTWHEGASGDDMRSFECIAAG